MMKVDKLIWSIHSIALGTWDYENISLLLILQQLQCWFEYNTMNITLISLSTNYILTLLQHTCTSLAQYQQDFLQDLMLHNFGPVSKFLLWDYNCMGWCLESKKHKQKTSLSLILI